MEFILGFITAIVIGLIFKLFRAKNSERKYQSNIFLFKRVTERGEADTELRKKLISMLGGDEKKAEMLVARKRFGKEGKYSENYCWWLAIRELEQTENKK
ncbi:hypothetical protein [Prochlorothrix hollandica]|uniref:Uncharacterized protein n=1 Tax=Prochlorothrix hollandica PCC 9006 = CALU 1027 TaxID=317619 RepID=A0A0M2Q041_PROHO|nr:hypothetical protein [Prochlorothrix hollandica]KKJ00683.1 hypothetical protein PROH_05185 [Prochlorothrix hollandica PCC 9006 = CALU 1027]